ncbi:MAG: CHAT domain-containing tetratricopeptide repeat protein [Chitinophagaceae bacterium]
MKIFLSGIIKIISLGIVAWAFCLYSYGQHAADTVILNKLIGIEKDTVPLPVKLQQVLNLKKQYEDRKLAEDSVYARILHRIGQLKFSINDNVATKDAITFTVGAVRINSAGKTYSSPAFCVNSYTNLGNYYRSLQMYDVAATYYDSAIIKRKRFNVPRISEVQLLLDKGQMLYQTGDYQKAIEDFNTAIIKARIDQDSITLADLLIQRAQSYIRILRLDDASNDVIAANKLSRLFKDTVEIINGMFIMADILVQKKDFTKALTLYSDVLTARLRTKDDSRIADDYIMLGHFYNENLHDYKKAKQCFFTAIKYGQKTGNADVLSRAHLNLGAVSFYQHKYKEAEHYYIAALQDLKITAGRDIMSNPSAKQLSLVGNKEQVIIILANKTDLLLNQFKQLRQRNYLSACLQTALLTDTLITTTRFEQLGEQSKLYWRERTRAFFTYAIEACWLAADTKLAFYFIEKSRAALLNDKLNELSASSRLPFAEAEMELEYKISVILEQQKFSSLKGDEIGFENQQLKLLQAKTDLEHYVRSLEKKYPVYYQNKYADEVPSLGVLQKHLLINKQSFLHYFMNDTVAYILTITPGNSKLVKLSKENFNNRQLIDFLQLTSNEPTTINQYASFASLSYLIYNMVFRPLNIPAGRVVICSDNFLIPFEALCTDNTGRNFLVNDYIFSYVYSARLLMKLYNLFPAEGDFVGFAPVSFKAYPNVPDLKPSGYALKQSARYYSNKKLLRNDEATRNKFISAVSRYTIVNVFSHAQVDSTENEPVLYMYDSTIRLSELQLIRKPATELVVLSACQTNIGKNAKGEGIFSLAREFASVGIPSVAATMWKADEQAIYAISDKFHEFLSQGLPKDVALQKAKLHFINKGGSEKPVPYYWANMILIGNQEAIKLSENDHTWWWMAGLLLACFLLIIIIIFCFHRLRSYDKLSGNIIKR